MSSNEMCYIDENGRKTDIGIAAELLGEDPDELQAVYASARRLRVSVIARLRAEGRNEFADRLERKLKSE